MSNEAERGAPRPDNPKSVRNGSTEPNRTSDNLAPDDSIGAIQAHEIDRLRAERDAEAALADAQEAHIRGHGHTTWCDFIAFERDCTCGYMAIQAAHRARRTKNESEQH